MASHSHRIFVGNLPHEVTRDQVVSKFRDYGNVESVDIKTKKDTTSDQVIATFGYVNLNTDKDTLSQCILLLNGIKWGQRHLKVEVAKESFLQRLQRERQSANKPNVTQASVQPQATKVVSNSPSKKESKIIQKKPVAKRPPSSSESSDSEDDNGSFHPNSKLPMFKGISSVPPAKPQPTPKLEVKKEKLIPAYEIKKEKPIQIEQNQKHSRRENTFKKFSNSVPGQSTDILKKFELFSDVWKDDDEEPYPSESKYGLKVGKKQSYNNEFQSNKPIRNDLQSQNQSFKSEEVGANVAEEKRLKSIEEKRQAFEQQKKAVQQALSDKNAPKSNKKIVFDDDADDEVETVVPVKKPRIDSREGVVPKPQEKKSKALTLFDDSDDEETGDWSGEFKVKKQFEGQKGKKLLELQNKYNNDQRFNLDERFYDSDEEAKSKDDTKTEESEKGVEGLAEEREQQLQILSGILGKPIPVSLPPSHHESKAQGMLRFDPLKPNHSRYELTKEPQESKKKKKSKLKKTEDEDEEKDEETEESVNPKVRREEKDPEPVSQSKFYSVSETLADSLKLAKEGQSSGFSLLQMFGSSNTTTESKGKYTEVVTKSQGLKKGFNLDDSSSEDEVEESKQQGPTAKNSPFQSTNKLNSGIKSTGGVWQESFFFQPNDDRLKEGADFFSQIDSSDPALFAKKREALKRIVKIKLRKTNRKANSFKNKVGTLRKKANLWPKSSNMQRPRKRQKH